MIEQNAKYVVFVIQDDEYHPLYQEYDTVDEALNDVRQKLKEHGECEGFLLEEWDFIRVGKKKYFEPQIKGWRIIEDMQNDFCEEMEGIEPADDYLGEVTKEQEHELEEMLTKVFLEWEEKHGLAFCDYIIVDVDRYELGDVKTI